MKKLILVDKKDKIVGYGNKEKCHRGRGILHRAFTIFISNSKNQVLIQKRSQNKLLWPLFWETSCSSHPQKGENIFKTAKKRLKKELGVNCQLKLVAKFQYQTSYKDIGSENEICSILTGRYDGIIRPDPKEVADWKWAGLKELKKDIIKNPRKYTLWLKMGLKKYEIQK